MHHTLIDLFSFLFTTALVIGTVLVIALLVRKCTSAIDATKGSLEKRGWKVSSHGMSVPVGRRSVVDREHYLDVTQRGLSRAANASTFGGTAHGDHVQVQQVHADETEHRHHRLHLFKRHMD